MWQAVTNNTKRKSRLRGSDSDNLLYDTESDSDMNALTGREFSTHYRFI